MADKSNKPYSLPLNFVAVDGIIYFHGAKKGKKIDILKSNNKASFSVVDSYSVIPSFFSSTNELASSATHFFKSVIIDGAIEFVSDYDEKVLALNKLMEKLQPEGKYQNLVNTIYEKIVNATMIFKLIPDEIELKIRFGQRLNKERFEMVINHLKERNRPIDILTIEFMKQFRD